MLLPAQGCYNTLAEDLNPRDLGFGPPVFAHLSGAFGSHGTEGLFPDLGFGQSNGAVKSKEELHLCTCVRACTC